jgi:hypothetical protein
MNLAFDLWMRVELAGAMTRVVDDVAMPGPPICGGAWPMDHDVSQ